MPSTVHLQVQQPDGTSKAFELTEHDTFLLGRMEDCHLCLPNDDRVSRHHFLLEACPLSRAQADTRAIAQFKREMDVIAKL